MSTSPCATAALHALIGPNGAGKTTAFNLISGFYTPDEGDVFLKGKSIAGLSPEAITHAGIGRSFQITNLFPALSVEENLRLAIQARHAQRFDPWTHARSIDEIEAETSAVVRYLGVAGIERAEAGALSYGGQRLLDMGLALATKPRVLLLDEPLAGLAAAERQRIGDIIKRISSDVPMLLVEHDIDRVFQIADAVTVMNEGQVLVDGTVEDARSSPRVQEIYIGSGAATVAAKPRESAVEPAMLLTADRHQHLLRQEPRAGRRLVRRSQARDRGAAGPQRGREVDAPQDLDRHRKTRRPGRSHSTARRSPVGHPTRSPGSALATCRRDAGSSPG